MESVATKSEPILEGSVSPSVSTPEVEVEALTQDVAQTQKRKGGRKPVCKIFFYILLFTLFLLSVFYATSNPGPRTPLFNLFFPLFNSYRYHFRILLLTHPPYLTLPFRPSPPLFLFFFFLKNVPLLILSRSMQPPRSVSNATDRRRRLSVNVALSIYANSSLPSSVMKIACRLSSRITALQPMSVLCCGIRTPCWKGSCSRRVSHIESHSPP